MNDVKRTEHGWGGHFCCSQRCLFRRNTLIEYKNKKWIISTVGNYRPPNLRYEREAETIGTERYYETMAFEAEHEGGYWEADTSNQIYFDSQWGLFAESWKQLLAKYPDVDNAANDMHEKVVDELMEKIKEVE